MRDALIEARPQPRPSDVVRHARRGDRRSQHDGERDLGGVGHARGGGGGTGRQAAELHRRYMDTKATDPAGVVVRSLPYRARRRRGHRPGFAARGASWLAAAAGAPRQLLPHMRGRARGVALRPQPCRREQRNVYSHPAGQSPRACSAACQLRNAAARALASSDLGSAEK